MAYHQQKTIELYLLMAEHSDSVLAPNLKQYYLDVAEWLKNQDFSTAEEAVSAMKDTPYYEGGIVAKQADERHIRNKALEDAGITFSQEKFDICRESFYHIFHAYLQMIGNPQGEYRQTAEYELADGLKTLASLEISFEQLAEYDAFRKLTMTNDAGMQNFVDFVDYFVKEKSIDVMTDEITVRQEEIARWVRVNQDVLQRIGKDEKWGNANCVAVPSASPDGYDYVELREV